MAGSIDELELNWDEIDDKIVRFDNGEISTETTYAKMLSMAYDSGFQAGYERCEDDHNVVTHNIHLMLTQPAGHA